MTACLRKFENDALEFVQKSEEHSQLSLAQSASRINLLNEEVYARSAGLQIPERNGQSSKLEIARLEHFLAVERATSETNSVGWKIAHDESCTAQMEYP